ncbi:hypothetical protein SPB21_34945 [Leptothoe sp. ISB3NOV94-8A]
MFVLYELLRSAEEPKLPNYVEAMPNYGASPLSHLANVVSATANQEERRRLG